MNIAHTKPFLLQNLASALPILLPPPPVLLIILSITNPHNGRPTPAPATPRNKITKLSPAFAAGVPLAPLFYLIIPGQDVSRGREKNPRARSLSAIEWRDLDQQVPAIPLAARRASVVRDNDAGGASRRLAPSAGRRPRRIRGTARRDAVTENGKFIWCCLKEMRSVFRAFWSLVWFDLKPFTEVSWCTQRGVALKFSILLEQYYAFAVSIT